MTGAHTIRLSRGATVWHARYEDANGAPLARIVAAFGTDTLPTPFGVEDGPELAIEQLERLNPGVRIQVAS